MSRRVKSNVCDTVIRLLVRRRLLDSMFGLAKGGLPRKFFMASVMGIIFGSVHAVVAWERWRYLGGPIQEIGPQHQVTAVERIELT